MTSPRGLRALRRRLLSRAVNALWDTACEVGVAGPDDPRARRFGRFGTGSLIGFPPGVSYNEHCIHIGTGTMIGPYVSITAGMAPGQQMVTDPVVSIGDRCVIGRGSHIVGHFCIEIGDDIQTGPYVYITDQNHTYEDPDLPIGRQWPTDREVHIGSGSWLGTAVVVLPGARVGRNVTVGAGSVVVGELPDHCVAVGVPARVVKRHVAGEGWTDTAPGPAGAASAGGGPADLSP